jgi:hypothetical protein
MAGSRTLLAVAAVAVVGAVGWVALRSTGRDDATVERRTVPVPEVASSTPATDEDSSVPAGPSGDSSGVPTGYVRTVAGARAAAVGWVSALGTLMELGPIAAADALRAVTSGRVAEATVESFRQERARFRDQFNVDPSVAIWMEAPLAVTVTDWTSDVAEVRVWSQVVMGAPGQPTVTALWRTHTLRLVWEHADWKVDDTTVTEGPTPVALAEDLPSGGDEFAQVAGWTPAVLAASSVEGN